MTFFAEDVHLLARYTTVLYFYLSLFLFISQYANLLYHSASIDGRVFVWKIDEVPDEENKPQITEKKIIAVQIVGNGESYHPRICWHSHKQVSSTFKNKYVVNCWCLLYVDFNL